MRVTVSEFVKFCESPKHYWWSVNNKEEPSTAMIEGTAFHMAIFEPEKFQLKVKTLAQIKKDETIKILSTVEDLKKFLIRAGHIEFKGALKPELIELCKIYIKDYPDTMFEDDLHEKFTILTDKSYDNILKMRDSVFETKFWKVNGGLGKAEVSIEGEIDGVHFRGRIDKLFEKKTSLYFMDAKKTRSAKRKLFESEIVKNGTHIQMTLYSMLLEQKYKLTPKPIILPCEGKAPFICQPFEPDESFINMTKDLILYKIKEFKKCYKENYWPGYSSKLIEPCQLPSWTFSDFEYEHIEDEDDE